MFNAIHLDSDHWNNLDAKHRNWSEYNENSEQRWHREALTKIIIKIIKIEILPGLTSRQQQVIQLYFVYQLRQVQIAKILGTRDARKVGWALHGNKDLETPCHRVVNKQGGLAKTFGFGGARQQKKRLLSEGVGFINKTQVDLKRHLWEPKM